jgi:hypothetical protein
VKINVLNSLKNLIGPFRKAAARRNSRHQVQSFQSRWHTQAYCYVAVTQQKSRRKPLCFGVFITKVLARNNVMV